MAYKVKSKRKKYWETLNDETMKELTGETDSEYSKRAKKCGCK